MNKNQKLNNFTQTVIQFIVVYLIIKNFNNNNLKNNDILSLSIIIIFGFKIVPELINNNKNITIKKDNYKLNEINENNDVTFENNDVPFENSDVTFENNDVPFENSDVTFENNDVTFENSDVIFENSEVTPENNEDISLEEIYNAVNNNNNILEHFSDSDNESEDESEDSDKINYASMDRKIKLKFNLPSLNKIELDDGKYIINDKFNTYGYNNFIVIDGKLIYADSNKKYAYKYDKKYKRYIDKKFSIIFLKNKDYFIDQDYDKVFFKKLKLSKEVKEDTDKKINKKIYEDDIEDLDKEITENARIRYYTYRKYVDKDGKEKYKLINNKFYDKSLDDKVLIDLNTIPHDIRQDNYDPIKTYGYSYVPPNEWYDVPSRKESCITGDEGPFVRPTLTDGSPYDSLFWTKNIEKE
jgi:hypothetical protein